MSAHLEGVSKVRREDWSRKEWATYLASQGFSIIPLSDGAKEPVEGSWKESKTTDPDTIHGWFSKNPMMNYGVVPDDRHCVIDIDVKGGKPGLDNLGTIECEQQMKDWITGATLTVASPSKGLHFYLGSPFEVGNSNSRFPEGIDVRGSGGYVVGPGSALIQGRCKATDVPGQYMVVNDDEIRPAPAWVVSRLRPPGTRDENRTEPMFELDLPFAVERAREFLSRRSPAIEGNNGNDHTYATAVQVKDLGVSEQMCVELMLEDRGWNDRCDPPWPKDELEIVVYNAYNYGNQRPGSKGGIMELMDGADTQDVADLVNERYKTLDATFFKGFGITKRNKRRESVIPYWLPAHGMVINLARRSWGKSVVMVDMALRIACDMDWHGLPVQPGRKVVYICGEDDEGLEEQIRAWCQYHSRTPTDDRFIVSAGTVNLLSANDVELWTKYLLDTWVGHDSCVTFVDTWQRATARGKQNADDEMQTAVAHIEAMAKSLRGPAIVAFHPPKHDATTTMGSSVIENSSVAIWQGEDSTLGKKLHVTRIKGKGFGNYRTFKFEEIDLGEKDEFGNSRTGAVPAMVAGSAFTAHDEVDKNSLMIKIVATFIIDNLETSGTELSVKKIAVRLSANAVNGRVASIKLPAQRTLERDLPVWFKMPYSDDSGRVLVLIDRSGGKFFKVDRRET